MVIVNSPTEAIRTAWAITTGQQARVASPRGQTTHEVLDWSITIQHPDRLAVGIPGRNLRPAIGVLEGLQLVGQTSSPEVMQARTPALMRWTNDGVADGAYGLRIHGMLPRVVRLLQEDPYSRQAVLSVYSTREDLTKPTLDVPCTLSIQFMLRGGVLLTRTSMRSNDVWLGLPYDLMQFGMLAQAVAQALHVEVGPLHHMVGSLHVYEQHREQAHTIANAWPPAGFESVAVRWGSHDIGGISSRARALLHNVDRPILQPTLFERWALETLHGRTP